MGGEIEAEKPSQPKKEGESSNWVADNVAHPFVNAAVLEPINAVASVSEAVTGKHLPRVDLYAVPESNGTASWLAQTLSGGVGAIAPYVVAGKLTGGAMESGGRLLEANNLIKTSGMTAKFLSSERSAMIIGAGLYGGARDPMGNETRFGNAVGSMVGFGAFELGNSFTKGLSLSKSIPLRALVGAGGGTAQLMTSNLISEGSIGSTDHLMKAASSGAALNLFLPAASHGLGKAIDAANVRMGRPIPVDHFVARENWNGNDALQSLVERSPLTRVQRSGSSESTIDQQRNVVQLGKTDGADKLGHEISHRISGKQAEADYKAAADLLKTDPEAAKQKFIDIRTAQEKAAIEAESRVRAAMDYKSPYADTNPDVIHRLRANKDLSYGDLFKSEAAEFERSDGKYRPKTDYAEYKGINPENGLQLWVYDVPKDNPFGGREKVGAYETNDSKSFQRWTKADAIDENGRTWGTIEQFDKPEMTPYGTATRVESFPDKSIAYHIIEGANGVPDNTVFRAYTKGLQSEFGEVTSTTTHPDGSVVYGRMDGSFATKHATPVNEWYGKIESQDNKNDGSIVYSLTDGATVEWYPNPITTKMIFADGTSREVQVETAWRSNGKAQRSMIDRLLERGDESTGEPVANSAPNKSEYLLPNETTIEQINHADRIEMIERPAGGSAQSYQPERIVESYTRPVATTEGPANQITRLLNSTEYELADGAGTKVQVFNNGYVLPTEFGDVTRVVRSSPGDQNWVQYDKTNGNKVMFRSEGTLPSAYGELKAFESTPDGSQYFHRADGTGIVERYPQDVSTNYGAIQAVEQTPNGMTLYRADGAADYSSVKIDFANKRMTFLDANGDVVPNGFAQLPADFSVLRQFNAQTYPAGKIVPEVPVGKVRSIETDANGVNTYTLVDGRTVSEVRE